MQPIVVVGRGRRKATHVLRTLPQRRFLSDESFVQTVLMHSPLRHTLVNNNLRHIYWPHQDGDPSLYWRQMGWSFIGGPQAWEHIFQYSMPVSRVNYGPV